MAASYVGIGTYSAVTTSLTLGVPAGAVNGDLLIMVIETANQPIASVSGWNKEATFGVGTAGGTGVAFDVFSKIMSGDTSVSVGDAGNHTYGVILAIRGTDTTTPIYSSSVNGTIVTGSSRTLPSVLTYDDNSIVLNILVLTLDSASTAIASGWSNSNFSLTEIFDRSVTTGRGGGIAIAYGVLPTAGASGTTTVSHTLSGGVWGTFSIKNVPSGSPINTNAFFNFF